MSARIGDDYRQQQHHPGQQARDYEADVQQLLAHDRDRDGNRDERDGEQHLDGRAGNQAPGQDHDQRHQDSQQQPEELTALDV